MMLIHNSTFNPFPLLVLSQIMKGYRLKSLFSSRVKDFFSLYPPQILPSGGVVPSGLRGREAFSFKKDGSTKKELSLQIASQYT